jgi:hypothetical protein
MPSPGGPIGAMACIEICSVRPPQRLVVLVVGGERYN